ncbi:MAG: hypothetical protein HOO95_03990 [Gallionella sp.]|nr:hypothetical protein [Gallionella sp.]
MKKFIKAVVLASALALPTFFAGNAFAIPSCGTNCTSASKNPHGYIAATPVNCYSCHTTSNTGGGNSGGTTGGTLTVKPTFKSCGACAIGTAPAGVGAHKNVTAATLCSVCHISGTAGGGTTGGSTVTVHPTTHSCGACVAGTAPGSVSAHKNVNNAMTACSFCHSGGSTGGTGSGNTGDHQDNGHGSPGGTAGDHHDNHDGSPGNSDFGHSHKHDKKQHRDHQDRSRDD